MSETSGWTRRLLKQGEGAIGLMRARMDSWANTLTGLGTARDKTASTLPYVDAILPLTVLEALYHGDDIAARIVTAVPVECFREPWQIVNKESDEKEAEKIDAEAADLEADCKRLGVRQKYKEAFTWGRLYGRGAVLIGAEDGGELWEPLDPARVRAVNCLTVLDARDLQPWRWYTDLAAPLFGEISHYVLQPTGVFVGGGGMDGKRPFSGPYTGQPEIIHESRLIQFGGDLTSRRERQRNQGADYSILQKCFRALQLTNNNWQSVSALLADASQGVFKIKGLIDMIAADPKVMQDRMALVDQMRSVLKAIILDADGEEFERVATPLAGVSDLLIQTWNRLAMAAHMPLTVLLGVSPAGMNATGESDRALWYDQIAAEQRDRVLPALERLLLVLASARGFAQPEDWTVQFAPLWRLRPAERAEYNFKLAQADHQRIDDGIWLAEEVALARDADPLGERTTIDTDTRKQILRVVLKRELEDAKNPPARPVVGAAPPNGKPKPAPPTPPAS